MPNPLASTFIAVVAQTPNLLCTAKELAIQLGLPLADSENSDYETMLVVTEKGLMIASAQFGKPLQFDFTSAQLRYRYKKASLKKELLARTIGIHPKEKPFIVDATMGTGNDCMLLAALGYEVTALERAPILYCLLNDALQRALLTDLAPVMERVHLIETDAIAWLKQMANEERKPDVIYLDPMFPQKSKVASAKKEMVILQQIAGKDSDSEQLFAQALACASYRVVVKRPRLGCAISALKPSFSFTGSSSRFDIYQR